MHVGVTRLKIYLLLMIIEEIVFVKIVFEKRLVNKIYVKFDYLVVEILIFEKRLGCFLVRKYTNSAT